MRINGVITLCFKQTEDYAGGKFVPKIVLCFQIFLNGINLCGNEKFPLGYSRSCLPKLLCVLANVS